MKTTEISKVNPSEYGIEESKANELVGNLPQIISEREILTTQFDEVVKMDIECPQTAKRANELRKLIKNNRTKGIEVWHKTTKDYFLRGGQFVDAIKRKEVAINERMENALEEIESYAEKKEAQRKEALRIARVAELRPYAEFVPIGINLGELNEDEYKKIYNGSKLQYDAKIESERKAEKERIEAARKAEEERIAKEKAEAEERERIRLENEKLRKEAEEKEKLLMEERAKAEAQRKAIEEKARKEREEAERKASEERAKQEAILKAEREAKAKLEAELRFKKEAEIKAENERKLNELKAKAEAEKLAKAPIKKQLMAWVDTFEIKEFNGNNVADEITAKFHAFKKWAKNEVNNI